MEVCTAGTTAQQGEQGREGNQLLVDVVCQVNSPFSLGCLLASYLQGTACLHGGPDNNGIGGESRAVRVINGLLPELGGRDDVDDAKNQHFGLKMTPKLE